MFSIINLKESKLVVNIEASFKIEKNIEYGG